MCLIYIELSGYLLLLKSHTTQDISSNELTDDTGLNKPVMECRKIYRTPGFQSCISKIKQNLQSFVD